MYYLQLLKDQFDNKVDFKEKRNGIYQLFAPLFYEDGDMMDIFIDENHSSAKNIRISDFGMTLMRLSYHFELNTENKEKVFEQILNENGANFENGTIYIDSTPESLYKSILQYSQIVGKVTNMQLYSREVVKSLFYEMLEQFIQTSLSSFKPNKDFLPNPNNPEYIVDYAFKSHEGKDLFLFGVKDVPKARLVTITTQRFIIDKMNFSSCVVYEDIDNLTKRDLKLVMSATEKQFPDFGDFKKHSQEYLQRELKVA